MHTDTTTINGQPTDLLGIGQKSGIYWTLNPATGAVWQTQVGAGGPEGGIEWGSATDGSGGAAIVSGSVYWGSGYYLPPAGVANDKLCAFSLPG